MKKIIFKLFLIAALFSSCAVSESLTEPNRHDRTIVGYTNMWGWGKGNTHYKVIDGDGCKAIPVKIGTDTLAIGEHMICRDYLRHVR